MDFLIRFLILTLTTIIALSASTERWAKYNVWLMIGFILVAGVIFIA